MHFEEIPMFRSDFTNVFVLAAIVAVIVALIWPRQRKRDHVFLPKGEPYQPQPTEETEGEDQRRAA